MAELASPAFDYMHADEVRLAPVAAPEVAEDAPLVLVVDDCRAAYDRMRARGVEFIQEPVDRFGTVDAGFRDPSGNGWKMIEARRRSR
jgi:uncharacterized glyoxalase superfamily protein PhnB